MIYAAADKSLIFVLKTTKAQLDAGQGAGEPFDLVNTLTFKVHKK